MGDYDGSNGIDGTSEIDESAVTQEDIPVDEVQDSIQKQEKKQLETQELRTIFGGMTPAEIKYNGIIREEGRFIQKRYKAMTFPCQEKAGMNFEDYIYQDKYFEIIDYIVRDNLKKVLELHKSHYPKAREASYDETSGEIVEKSLEDFLEKNPDLVGDRIMSRIKELEPRYNILEKAREQNIDPSENSDKSKRIEDEEYKELIVYEKFKKGIIKLDKKFYDNELKKLSNSMIAGNMLENPAESMVYYFHFWEFLAPHIERHFQHVGKFEDERFQLLSTIGEGTYKLKFGAEPPNSLRKKDGKYDIEQLFIRIYPPKKEGEEVTPFYIAKDSLPKAFRRLEILRKSVNALVGIVYNEEKDSITIPEAELEEIVNKIKKLGKSMQNVSDKVGESDSKQILETYDKGKEAVINLGMVYDALLIDRGETIDQIIKKITVLNQESKTLSQKEAQIDQLEQKNQRLESEREKYKKGFVKATKLLDQITKAVNTKLGGM